MVKLAIRDDDVSFFTNSEDILNVYSELGGFPISYAVVPYMLTNSYEGGNCKELIGNTQSRLVGENIELVRILKNEIKNNRAEILLHGYTHEYRKVGDKVLAEFLWRSPDECYEVIRSGKKHLEEAFGVDLKWFVAPSNLISRANFSSIIRNKMSYSGIINISMNRPINIKTISNYFFRFSKRIFHPFGYPGLLDYGTHQEIYACPILEGEYLYKIFDYCNANSLPMAINSHYWDIRDHEHTKRVLFSFIDYALSRGAVPSLLSNL